MDVVGSEIGQKMRSAIKAKLTELGCYVDDELPDYVMVMVANKRTRSQMEDDLQLFLGDNTELFVNWLHQVLKKLQEVTVSAPTKNTETEIVTKERSTSKERKSKEKKEKSKKSESSKKSKKKAKEKIHKKKDDKKKNKKKNRHEMIRPNIPPLLMNIEKESEPSITDVFAGQILKNHGIILETHKDEPKVIEQKPIMTETKRPIIPIIDPASIPSQSTDDSKELNTPDTADTVTSDSENVPTVSKEDKVKEIHDIEAKIEGLRQKLADQLDSTDDEDFLNIRTEADELINDFAEDVYKEISQPLSIATPPLHTRKSRSPSPSPPPQQKAEVPKQIPAALPQIELNLPKRPIRERLGAPTQKNDAAESKEKSGKTTEIAENSPERCTPEKEPVRPQLKSAKSRLGSQQKRSEPHRKNSTSDDNEMTESNSKRLTSRVSVLENRPSRVTCASVVRVRPRPRVSAPASSLLLRAVADAHKSLLNIPPKVEPETQKVKRALVLPMRRCVDAKKIVIEVPCNEPANSAPDTYSDNISLGDDLDSEVEDKSPKASSNSTEKEEYTPMAITKVIQNTEYVPSRTLIRKDDRVFVETINIHNTTVDKDKKTQFIVTMDGYHPNAFLAKKLMTEGLLNDEEEIVVKPNNKTEKSKNKKQIQKVSVNVDNDGTNEEGKGTSGVETIPPILSDIQTSDEINEIGREQSKEDSQRHALERRNSNVSTEKSSLEKRKTDISIEKPVLEKRKSDSVEKPVMEKRKTDRSIDKPEKSKQDVSVDKKIVEKRKSDVSLDLSPPRNDEKTTPPVKKRKASPIVFDVHKKEKDAERVRERTLSASSDSHVVLTTTSNSNKYDTLPSLSQASKMVWCRAFPQCRYGAACVFAHPRCKFAAACTRRGCVYSHALSAAAPVAPVVASHVVPAANYKSISAGAFPNICKFYPSCSNPACHYYHPKPCRYGKACANKLECNFYHHDVPGGKWKYSL